MRWDIEDKLGRIDLWFFTGINFGGMKKIVRIHPYGGLQGADIEGADIKSMGVIAEPGVRVILRVAATNNGWETLPWRCIQVLKGHTGKLSDGRTCVQIPDLDMYNAPTARRTDPEIEEAYPHADTLELGKGWSFGRTGKSGLKCNVRSIRVERIPDATVAAEAPVAGSTLVPRADSPELESTKPVEPTARKDKEKPASATIPVSDVGPGSVVKED